jgi:hypothetical protein
MKAYGVNPRFDRGCCPGHDTFPRDSYKNSRSKRAHRRDTKIAHRRARRVAKKETASAA